MFTDELVRLYEHPLSRSTEEFYELISAKTSGASRPPNFSGFRIDIPVQFGSYENADARVIIYGSEPRDTDVRLDVLFDGQNVLATPFGCDHWSRETSVSGGMRKIYRDAFLDFVNPSNGFFVLFSDIYKKYQVVGSHSDSDNEARNTFRRMFVNKKELDGAVQVSERKKALDLIRQELELIKPDVVVCLGCDAFNAANNARNELSGLARFKRVRHPSHGGKNEAIKQLSEIKKELLSKKGKVSKVI